MEGDHRGCDNDEYDGRGERESVPFCLGWKDHLPASRRRVYRQAVVVASRLLKS